jgi:hypothetical protein
LDFSLTAELQPLRGLAKDEIREIDPEAMAVATAEQGGLLTPRWRARPVPADFVVLIDRTVAEPGPVALEREG